MKSADVLDYFYAENRYEAARLLARKQTIMAESKGFAEVHNKLFNLHAGSLGRPPFWPLLSHELFAKTFGMLRATNNQESAQRALRFISQNLIPLSRAVSVRPPAPAILGKDVTGQCKNAEEYFKDCLALANGQPQETQPSLRLYHDSDGTPLFLRKARENHSSLTLRPISIVNASGEFVQTPDTVHIPAGCIAAIDGSTKAVQTGVLSTTKGDSVTTWQLDGLPVISPMRYTPWVYENEMDRWLFAVSSDDLRQSRFSVERDRGALVGKATLANFQNAAETLMTMR